ncbi:uncharacterized protein LOC123261466 isoform X2 [Cotesia glomerata]|uniref:uncharacterized protein LOC123261466 isoform X2 n=1 Tax=Cotesia glomerata TaxID=32391 RepID=UPI001D012778|nr:uncharacterized protein LOC123261466 isoform X2 [Cotesia glomerata]
MQLQRTPSVANSDNNNHYDKLLLNNIACKTMGSRTINSTVLHNRSFLHGDTVVVSDDKHNNKNTIDSLALRRASLPLQLVPNDIVCIDNNTDFISDDNDSSVYDSSTSIVSQLDSKELESTKDNDVEERISTESVESAVDTNTNKADIDFKDDVHYKDGDDSWENKTETKLDHKFTITRPKRYCPSSKFGSNSSKKRFIVKPRWIFTRTVLHYVPKHKRTRKLINNILPISKYKDTNKDNNKSINKQNNNNNKYNWPKRNVSLPSNFVHVAGVRRWSWLENVDDNSMQIINHKEKCATLTLINDKRKNSLIKMGDDDEFICKRSSSAETLVGENIKEPDTNFNKRQTTVSIIGSSRRNSDEHLAKTNNESAVYSSKLQANTSFLWSRIAKCSGNDNNNMKLEKLERVELCNYDDDDDEYDDVGSPSPYVLDDTYDDVGVPELRVNGSVNNEDEQVYDDVMLVRDPLPAKVPTIEKENSGSSCSSSGSGNEHDKNADKVSANKTQVVTGRNFKEIEKEEYEEEHDLIYMRNDYSTVDEDADDEVTVYDDVGVVLCESRVNSIYAGSINISQLDPSKESEWEDLDENSSINGLSKNLRALLRNASDNQNAWSNKKKSGQRRTRKVRRQRSKASRKNSARSTNRVSRPSTVSVDDYNILSEEPLYQFYAASTFRGAFQSDSDSYGDAEDSLPSASELGKPGCRTLWCQTPQVIKSGLLEQLTSDEKKLQEAKFEIITSEASYLNSLRVLVNEFLINHELVYEALSATDREKLFGSVPSVLIASERLLAELESVWRADPMLKGLPEVLLKHAERCSKIYTDYCSNQVSIDLTLKELRSKKSSKFVETVTRIESHPACQSLSLHSFLMLPMQRVTRLPLLADAVLSKLSTEHEERLDWEKVLSVLGRVVTECNEGARVAGRQIEMASLAKKIEYTTKVPSIDLRDRYLVRSGPVTQILAKPGTEYVLTFRKKFHKTPLYLLLLTDHLLIAKLKSNNQDEVYSVIDSCKRSLIALEKVPDDSPFAGRHAMILTLLDNYCSRHVEYILSCQNSTERERWLDAVSPPKPNLVGETLYETWDCPQVMALYSYTPVQPDELSLQPGDVINVLRKMADGWNLGEKLVGGEQGWFPGNYTKEVASEHVRAKNLRQRHRLLALSESLLQQYANQSVCINR